MGMNSSSSCCNINITILHNKTGTIVCFNGYTKHKLTSSNFSCTCNIMIKCCNNFTKAAFLSSQNELIAACFNSKRCFNVNCRIGVCFNSSICSKNVFTILNIACIFSICFSITGQSCGEFCFRRNNRCFWLNIRAFAILFKGDIAGLLCLAACGQAIGNLHETGQVLLTACKIAVGQLACQRVQHVSYASVAVHSNTGVIGDQRYYRAFCCTLDNGVASLIVLGCFAIAFMCIVDVGVAAVVVDSQAVAILLEDIASFCIACATYEVSYLTALEDCIALPITLGRTMNFVSPACTILQPQVDLAVVTCHVSYAFQSRFFCIQSYVDDRCCCIASTVRCCQIALQHYVLAQASGCFAAIQSNIHVDGAIVSTHCCISTLCAAIVDSNCTAAIYGNNRAVTIGMQAIAVSSDIYVTVNSNCAVGLSVSTALCHDCGNRGVVITTLATVNISLQAAVYSYICISCQNAIYVVVVTLGISCSNIYSTVNGNVLSSSVPVTCINTVVFACRRSAGLDNQLISSNINLGGAVIDNLDC